MFKYFKNFAGVLLILPVTSARLIPTSTLAAPLTPQSKTYLLPTLPATLMYTSGHFAPLAEAGNHYVNLLYQQFVSSCPFSLTKYPRFIFLTRGIAAIRQSCRLEKITVSATQQPLAAASARYLWVGLDHESSEGERGRNRLNIPLGRDDGPARPDS
ncbi:hypothetical protein E2C01_043737 [Portunus trituberculatus]|uniref:Uncharacterized protein n=1 Tax=Portunus trituberculatus TaxID=210409 RepID=A0A5B7FTR2_PORTR|nr:hypothetical protein [Portunus trituberculatus]